MTSAQGPSSLFQTDHIGDIVPLDAQLGVWPLQTVPDTLASAIFGGPEGQAQGKAEGDAPLRTYVIIDAAKLAGGVSAIENCALPFRCLLTGDLSEDLADGLPYLVELSPDAQLTRVLFTHAPDVDEAMETVHLMHKEPGIVLRAQASFDEVWKSLRKFTRVSDAAGKFYFFRFWEPRNMAQVLASMTPDQVASFFRKIDTVVAIYRGRKGFEADLFSRVPESPVPETA